MFPPFLPDIFKHPAHLPRLFIDPLMDERIEDIHKPRDTAENVNLFAFKPLGIALTVPAFEMLLRSYDCRLHNVTA